MLGFMIILFWVSIAVLFYCYIGYGILIFLINSVLRIIRPEKKNNQNNDFPETTLVITAYNEEGILHTKLQNSLAIDYPAGKLKIILVLDGSGSSVESLTRQFPSVTILHQEERQGKYAAIKRAMRKVKSPVVIFSDANTMLNPACVKKMVAHYSDKRIGGVAGEKKIANSHTIAAVGQAEGLYWRYESFLKNLDARLNTVTGAAGELFSIRTHLFKELDDALILDDFVISMQICEQGYKIAYEPGSFATELPSATLSEEEKRKVRISAGAYQSIGLLKKSLNVFHHPLLTFQYVSRRLLRWVLCPLLLLALAAGSIFIVSTAGTPVFYQWMLYAQILFYTAALTGWIMVASGKKAGVLTIPFYFVFMNYCLVKGFVKFMQGGQTVLWEKAERAGE